MTDMMIVEESTTTNVMNASKSPVNITLVSGNPEYDEKAEISVNVKDPDAVVERMLRTLADKFPAEAIVTVASGGGTSSSMNQAVAGGGAAAMMTTTEDTNMQAVIASQRKQIDDLLAANTAAMSNLRQQQQGTSGYATTGAGSSVLGEFGRSIYSNVTGEPLMAQQPLIATATISSQQQPHLLAQTSGKLYDNTNTRISSVGSTTVFPHHGDISGSTSVATYNMLPGTMTPVGKFNTTTTTTTNGQPVSTGGAFASMYNQQQQQQQQLANIGTTGTTLGGAATGYATTTTTTTAGNLAQGSGLTTGTMYGGLEGATTEVSRTSTTTHMQGAPVMAGYQASSTTYAGGALAGGAAMKSTFEQGTTKSLTAMYGIPLGDRIVSQQTMATINDAAVLSERLVSSVQVGEEYPAGLPDTQDQVQYVEVPVVEEVIREVPVKQYVEVEKKVPKVTVEYVDKIVEVPEIQIVDRTVEVEQIQEVVRTVPRKQIIDVPKEVIRQVPKIETVVVEKVVEVPGPVIENPLPYQIEQKVAVPVVGDKEVATVVSQKLIPILGETNETFEVDLNQFEPVLIPVEIHIPVPVSIPLMMGKIQVDHRCVDIPVAHFNSLLKLMNARYIAQYGEIGLPYFVEIRTKAIPMLPITERVEIVEPISFDWMATKQEGHIYCITQGGMYSMQQADAQIRQQITAMFEAENAQAVQVAQAQVQAKISRSMTTTVGGTSTAGDLAIWGGGASRTTTTTTGQYNGMRSFDYTKMPLTVASGSGSVSPAGVLMSPGGGLATTSGGLMMTGANGSISSSGGGQQMTYSSSSYKQGGTITSGGATGLLNSARGALSMQGGGKSIYNTTNSGYGSTMTGGGYGSSTTVTGGGYGSNTATGSMYTTTTTTQQHTGGPLPGVFVGSNTSAPLAARM